MNISDPTLIDKLAAEYVLGTLAGAARRRFERLMKEDLLIRQATYDWERRLNGLASEVEPVVPSAAVWSNIQIALGHDATARPAPRRASRAWGWLAAALAVIAVTFAALYFDELPSDDAPVYTAVLQDAGKTPTWIIDAYAKGKEVRLRAFNPQPPPDGSVFELWMVPADGSAPVSLGLLGSGDISRILLADDQFNALAGGGVLAISIEPDGGSPTGAPTGEIPFSGSLTLGQIS